MYIRHIIHGCYITCICMALFISGCTCSRRFNSPLLRNLQPKNMVFSNLKNVVVFLRFLRGHTLLTPPTKSPPHILAVTNFELFTVLHSFWELLRAHTWMLFPNCMALSSECGVQSTLRSRETMEVSTIDCGLLPELEPAVASERPDRRFTDPVHRSEQEILFKRLQYYLGT